MTGPTSGKYDQRGLLTRTTQFIFNNISSSINGAIVAVRISALEIYNEIVTDLLREAHYNSDEPLSATVSTAASAPTSKLLIVETANGIIVPALYIMPVTSESDANNIFFEAQVQVSL